MRIDGSLPMHIARAYGVTTTPRAAAPKPAESSPPVQAVRAADTHDAGQPSTIDQLVAGRVSQAVDFNTATMPRPATASEPFQLYTRAADKIEAAIAVTVGQSIDVTG